LARNPDLTLTKLYNQLELLRSAEASHGVLSPYDGKLAERACVPLIHRCHKEIDELVAGAYGWELGLSSKEMLDRLVTLNQVRSREEASGKVRWLRKAFQAPRYPPMYESRELALEEPDRTRPEFIQWPGTLSDQVVLVASIVDRARRPVLPSDVARRFRGKRAATVRPVLDALAGMGRLRKLHDGRYAA
jgi:hypothetical protein